MPPLGPKFRVPWEHPRTPAENDENWRWLRRLEDDGGGTRWGTKVIAAADSSAESRATADYVCNGTTDSATVSGAILDALNEVGNARIVLLEGTFHFASVCTITLIAGQVVTVEGQGSSRGLDVTFVQSTNSSTLFLVNGATGGASTGIFRNFGMSTAGTCIATSASQVEIDGCSMRGAGGFGAFLNGGGVGPFGASYIHDCYFGTTNRGIEVIHEFGTRIHGCVFRSASTAIRLRGDVGATIDALITDNDIGGAIGISLNDTTDGTTAANCTIAGNYFHTTSTGIDASAATDALITGNLFVGCSNALAVGGAFLVGSHKSAFIGNYCYNSTGTRHVAILSTVIGTDDWTIAFNKFRGSTPAYAVEIGSGVSNACVAMNDTYLGYSTAAVLDNGTNTRRESAMIGSIIDTNARVGVRVNSAGSTYLRRRVNFIEGTGVTFSIADDAVDEEVDVTVSTNIASTFASKGDILVGLAASMFSRLPVDRDGQLLMVDSVATEGVKWGPKLTISPTAPSLPRPGDMWIDVS